jgi:Kef-type K+ transport system membrane component KefB
VPRPGEPSVVGELSAGLLLGPSALGAVALPVHSWLFPASILPYLDALAQLGVVFFMFLVGTELAGDRPSISTSRGIVVGHAAIAVPFLGGVITGWWLFSRYSTTGSDLVPFLLFIGLSFAVTAFPVLGRILAERGLLRTELGVTGMTAAAVGDVTAWCLLAMVIATVQRKSSAGALLTVALVMLFALIMLLVVRPLLARLIAGVEQQGTSRVALYAGLICLLLAAALCTAQIGVHPIFGAFLAGLVMPARSSLVAELGRGIEGITLWVMLPMFFVSVGLHTGLGVLAGWPGILTFLLITLVAVITKISATAVAAAATGVGRRHAIALGVMMNCRGLTELVVLDLGRQLGVLSAPLFVMFVLMALLTTAMTGPLLRRTALAEPGPTPQSAAHSELGRRSR